ncbi:MAG: DUF1330 domain-containing protein [Rhodospirillaceae bacterium]|nr:DUF1330 domain-containing protein [Rhodospirillaceae bacterium]
MVDIRFGFCVLLALFNTTHAFAEPEQLQVACDKPVIMLVIVQTENEKPLAAYMEELGKLPTYPDQQGYYQFTVHTEVFEGKWPENQGVLGANFPCAEAARGFWFSDEYQGIREVRSGAGTVTVSVHPIHETPAHITGARPKRLFAQQPTQASP